MAAKDVDDDKKKPGRKEKAEETLEFLRFFIEP